MCRDYCIRSIQQPTFEILAPIIRVAFSQSHGRINFSKADFEVMNRKGATWLGAYEKDELVGCVAVTEVSPARAKINKLAVLPDNRSTGLGSCLLLHVERVAYASGIRKMELVCQDNADGLVDYYKRHGYNKMKEKQYRKTQMRIAFMEKRIV